MSIIDFDKYWALRAHGVEWQYVLQELMAKYLPQVPAGHPAVLVSENPKDPLFLFEKEFFPIEALAMALGFTEQELASQRKVIELAVAPRPDLPAATVGYWGKA